MKLRYWVIAVLLVLAAGVFTTVQFTKSDAYTKVDMAAINDRYVEITQKLDKVENPKKDELAKEENPGKDELAIKEEYPGQIVFRSESDYEAKIHNAIKEQKIIMDYEKDGELVAKIIFDGQMEKTEQLYKEIRRNIICFFCILFAIFMGMMISIYMQYIRPFKKLENFAIHIAKGDLDFPLAMTKGNYFGAFTESFDIMREELKRARQGEYEANVSKKELVASLSHDIKTPVSTIKANCELLMVKVKDEEILEKLSVINQKAGMIDTLISDMFHATLEELMALKITPQEELSTMIKPMFEEINYYKKINFLNVVPECMITADSLRLNQVIDNVINNSYKYANTDIMVSFFDAGDSIEIVIKDSGAGVTEDELPLLSEKFYRGSNAAGQDGSGLGLYLSKVFMEGMGGSITYGNENGFVVKLAISKCN